MQDVLAQSTGRATDREGEGAGHLQGLAGEGERLPDRPGDAFVDAGDAAGFRIMAEAGVLPEEIVLKKKVPAAQQRLALPTDPRERKAAIAEIAELSTRQSVAEEARRRFLSR